MAAGESNLFDAEDVADGSVHTEMERLQAADEHVMRVMWDRYFPRLLEVARRRLPRVAGAVDDEQDVALSALESFFRAAQQGRFPNLCDRSGVWRLLSEMTRRKVVDRVRRHCALRRGGGQLHDHLGWAVNKSDPPHQLADSKQVSPSVELIAHEELDRLLAALREKDNRLAEIAAAKLSGCSNAELAVRFDRSIPTIERWLNRIRKIGQRLLDD